MSDLLQARLTRRSLALLCVMGLAFATSSHLMSLPCLAKESVTIKENWRFRKAGDSTWRTASVPGCVHTDLLDSGEIDDPFFRLNEKNQQWIGRNDWEYETTFEIPKELLKRENFRLIFRGLDTYADVYINETLALSADNMFRTWKIDCKEYLKPGTNRLRIYFHNVFKINLPKYEDARFELRAFRNNDQAKIKLNMYSRKAGFHYGWDWGPRFITCGIWRSVELQAWDKVDLENVFYIQDEVSSESAAITARFQVNSDTEQSAQLTVSDGAAVLSSRKVNLKQGIQKIDLQFTIENPRLWWTNGLGEQHLYAFTAKLEVAGREIASQNNAIGIRELKIIRQEDDAGKSMYVRLNGVPVFIKGANYIPQDNFQDRVSRDKYEFIIGSARDANMNMLRVWGGGIYEDDVFYDLCNQYGILVWQDTMFACAMYPANEDFLDNVRQEVIDNATRLRNHPSLALYCGNNEVEISWHEWGWKELYTEEEQKTYDDGLRRLFYKTIPEALAEADPTRYYHPSSPVTGFLGKPYNEGDAHYWGVWHGKEPFEEYENKVARFMSEYGFQSYPELSTVEKYTYPEDRFLESDVMHAHQRSMADEGKDLDYGNRLINHYLDRYFRTPKDFENHLYATQLLQAFGVQWAIEAHRRNMPHCMGTLYWQINDCWPVASWSSIDYYGKWKALHYAAKRAYEDVLISTLQRDDTVEIHLVSDQRESLSRAVLKLELVDFAGSRLWQDERTVELTGNSASRVALLELRKELDFDPSSCLLQMELIHDGQSIARRIHKFVFPREMQLSKPTINKVVEKIEQGYEIVLRSSCFASYVCLSSRIADGHFSENFFDMAPNQDYRILFLTEEDLGDSADAIDVKSLFDTYSPSRRTIQAAQAGKKSESVPQ